MPTKLTIPLTDSFYEEVEDAFIDKDISAQKFIFGLVKNMCKDAKAGKLNKSCSVNLLENGKIKQDFVKLKDVNMAQFELKSDPNWLPKDLDKENARNWEHSVTDKTMEYIRLYCQMVGLRFMKYHESLDKEFEQKIASLMEELAKAPESGKAAIQSNIDNETKVHEKSKEKRVEEIPTCIEQCIYNQVYPQLHQEVMKNMDNEFDKEFEEMYPTQKKEAPRPAPSR